ncbi:MAG: UxaA family hydrolase [Chloroflexi bacterium]|nr:UxaA family hydrolase [Chloroflexota bacterium]MCL5107727.1 UxaA family hydrolase [Chloroflexota bacterium]
MEAKRALIISPKDNVATVLQDVEAGATIAARQGADVREVVALEKIPFGFKVALTDIPRGAAVYKYGEIIGKSSQPIGKGELVHVHNVEGTRGRGDLATQGAQQ